MTYARGLFFFLVLSCMIASIYLFFPKATTYQQSGQAQEALSLNAIDFSLKAELQRGNLVQFFKDINHAFRIKHIKLEEHSLFIDFIHYDDIWEKETVFKDAYEVIAHVYLYTSNVNKLYIRFLDEQNGRQVLLCYIFAEREDFNTADFANEADYKSIILERAELTYGIGWRN